MEDNIQLFKHPEFGEVRVVMIASEPWFVAADVCRILELGNVSKAVSRLDDDEKRKITESRVVVDPNFKLGSDSREINVVNEPGLYRLIFTSRKPEAKKFQRWVYHEVLPSIRKTGSYSVNKNTLANGVELLAKALLKFIDMSRDDFAKAQLLRELASASGEDQVARSRFVRKGANLIMGENFIEETHDHDKDSID